MAPESPLSWVQRAGSGVGIYTYRSEKFKLGYVDIQRKAMRDLYYFDHYDILI
jgi:hypothetical protein